MIKLVISSTCSQFIINIPFIYVIYNSFKFFYKASMNLMITTRYQKKKINKETKKRNVSIHNSIHILTTTRLSTNPHNIQAFDWC